MEILNENDNLPQFVEKTIQPHFISEVRSATVGPGVLLIS